MEHFSSFGAPLVEGFETLKLAQIDEDTCREEGNDRVCTVRDTYSLNERPMDDDDEDEPDLIAEEDAQALADENETNPMSTTAVVTTSVVADDDDDDETDTELEEATKDLLEAEEEVLEAEEEVLEAAEAEDGDDVDEPFTNRNVIEGFAGSSLTLNKLMNFNLLLKSILFACLFYILAHPQTRSFITKNVFKKMKKTQYLYVAMVIYVVVYYVLNLVV